MTRRDPWAELARRDRRRAVRRRDWRKVSITAAFVVTLILLLGTIR